MSRRSDVCRDFVRGSCRFGARCKFIHDTSQQQRQQPSSPFGFGLKNQGPQQSNKGGNNYAALSSQKQQSQGQVKEHRCTDPRECKLQIKEDLENERPMYWRLTSYAHGKYLPNDIAGDVSFEELRAYAYDAGKQGMPLQSLIQNERNMAAAKSKEFEALLKNPYTGPVTSGSKIASFATAHSIDATKMAFGTSTSFANASPNVPKMSFGTATSFANTSTNAPKMTFGTTAPFGASTFPSGPSQEPTQSRGGSGGGFAFGLGQSQTPTGPFTTQSPAPGPFATQSPHAPGFSFGLQSFGSGISTQISPQQNSVQSNFGFGQNDTQMRNNLNLASGASPNLSIGKSSFQTQTMSSVPESPLTLQNISLPVAEVPVNHVMTNQISPHSDLSTGKSEIWMKASWKIGEIPEEEPPPFAR